MLAPLECATMGAIAAILSKTGPANPDGVRDMLAAASHYDGDSTRRTCGSCAIGVVNASDRIDSAVSSDGPWMAAFTGKLDNPADIAELVSARGFRPTSNSPADLIVAAFRAFGVTAPSRLRGMFAAVVTDGSDLWCFRDHLGWRALHYHDAPDRFVVASEPKQVILGAGLSRQPNLDVLEAIFYSTTDINTPSAMKGVERLPQATVLEVKRSGPPTQHRYWHPAELLERSSVPAAETAEHFVDVFKRAVARSLTGNGDVISLSGGIDSPAVAGFAAPLYREMTGQPLHALSTVYPNHPKVDESRYIEIVAKYLGMELRTFTPQAGLWDNLEHWVRVFDGPIPTLSLDEITEYYQLAHRLGYRNVLGGDIAEAVFNLNRHIVGHLVTRGRWKALAELSRTLLTQGTTRVQLAKFMAAPFIPGRFATWYIRRKGGGYPLRIPNWLSAAKVNEKPYRADLLYRGRDRWTAVQLRPFSGTSLTLEANQVASQLSGATSRSPFGDVDVIEFFVGLPAEVKFPDLRSKTLVRSMLRGRVPDEILDRRDKTVFNDYIMSHIDYGALRKYLVNPASRMSGVDYAKLAERIDRRDLTIVDFAWVNDLVRVHAFLSQW